MLHRARLSTPLGTLTLVASDAGLVAVEWPHTSDADTTTGDHPHLRAAATQLREYLAGTRRAFDLPLVAQGTPFQRAVWDALAAIPFGETRGYGELARGLGQPTATRAVAAANARNPLAIVVPCHRVVGANGALTGFAGGLAAKRWLLVHEGALLT